jgi:hypothetical protein
MTLQLPESVPLPKAGLLEQLSIGLGSGLEQGAKQAGPLAMKLMAEQQKQLKNQKKPFDIHEYANLLKDMGVREDLSDEDHKTLYQKLNELTPLVGRDKAASEVMFNLEKYLDPESNTIGEAYSKDASKRQDKASTRVDDVNNIIDNTKKKVSAFQSGPPIGLKPGQRDLWSDIGPNGPLAKGLNYGATGKEMAIVQGQDYKDWKKASKLNDKAGIWDNVLYGFGKFLSDSPNYLVGGVLGTAVPGIGNVAGAMGFNALINSSLEEFMKKKSQGFKGSFQDYLQSTANILSDTVYEGTLGKILGILGEAIPVLKEASPAIKKFFEEGSLPALKNMLGKTAVEGMGLTFAESVSKFELPTKESIAETFATVIGFNLFNLGTNKARNITERIRRSKNPEGMADTINKVKETAQKEGVDLNKAAEGNEAEGRKLDKIVKDITDSYKSKAEIKLPGEELSKVELEKREAATKEKAKELSKAPDEYFTEKAKKETPAEKKAKSEAKIELNKTNKEIDLIQENLNKINESLETAKTKKSINQLNKIKSNYENQIKDLQEQRSKLEYTAERGREPFDPAEATSMAKERVERLEDMAKNPKSYTKQEWDKMFANEAKYLTDQIEVLKRRKGETPVEPYKDRFIKTLEIYNDAYRNAIKELEPLIEKEKGAKKKKLEAIKKNLERNLDINDARLTKQRDKLDVKRSAKESSAILRNYLRQLKDNLPKMQKPITEYKKAIEGTPGKVSKEFANVQSKIKEMFTDYNEKTINNLLDDPVVKEAAAEESQENFKKETKKKAKKKADVIKEIMENGLKENIPPKEIAKEIMKELFKIEFKQYKNKILRAAAGGVVYSAIRKVIKDSTGYSLPYSGLALFLPIFKEIKFGAAIFSSMEHKLSNAISESYYRKKFRNATFSERRELRRKLKNKGWSPSRINKALKF